MNDKYTFSIITPVKDEINFFPKTVESVLKQQHLPREWIIVNDGSTDGTGGFIKDLERHYSWIKGIHLPPERKRKAGGEFVINKAFEKVSLEGLDYLMRLDGDIQFDQEYFSRLFLRMKINPKIGIAGGVCHIIKNNRLVEEKNPGFHVRGPVKTYKVECLKQIGGLGNELGWDTIDEIKAHMLGWETKSFPDLKVIHLRPTRGSSGWYRARVIDGISAYNSAYHPLFLLSRAAKHLFRPPVVVGSLAMIWAYIKQAGKPRRVDKDYIRFIRKHQINRLLGKETIWK